MHVVLYGKPHCSLCDDAREVVEDALDELFPDYVADITLLDITSNELLYQRYRHEIPVVAVDGEELFRLKVDPSALRSQLAARAAVPRSFAP